MAAGSTAAKPLDERLIDRMHELDDAYRAVLEARARNRSSLRDLLDDGMLSEEQARQVIEVYPPRKRGENGTDNG